MSYGEVLVVKSATDLILTVPDYIVAISFGCILYCGCFKLLCNAWVCVRVGFVMCAFW